MRMIASAAIAICLFLSVGVSTAADREKALTNADVVKLCQLGLGDAVVIAKIGQASRVRFTLDTEALGALKAQGVSGPVMAAMLERDAAAASESSLSGNAVGRVVLSTTSGDVELSPEIGTPGSVGIPYVGMRFWVAWLGSESRTETADRNPSFLIESETNPTDRYWFIWLDQDLEDNDRSVRVGGGILLGTQGKGNNPVLDYQVRVEATEEEPGLWRVSPDNSLSPREYGLYVATDSTLYSFSLTKN